MNEIETIVAVEPASIADATAEIRTKRIKYQGDVGRQDQLNGQTRNPRPYFKGGSIKKSTQPAHRPDKVLQSFNTWAFKREQPSDLQLMLDFTAGSIARGEPIWFVLYWGKGPRRQLDKADIECLEYLASLTRRVREVYTKGASVRLIFTDTHAALNGYSSVSIGEYFAAIEEAARQRGFEVSWLGTLTRAAEAQLANDTIDHTVPEEFLQQLIVSARKWFHGGGTPEQGAREYYRMNMVERRAVELAFPNAIFITFNGSEMHRLLPAQLPIFYMYSLRRGCSIKPWFIASDAGP